MRTSLMGLYHIGKSCLVLKKEKQNKTLIENFIFAFLQGCITFQTGLVFKLQLSPPLFTFNAQLLIENFPTKTVVIFFTRKK